MDEQRKTIVATLKAVRLGQLTAEQAVAILKLAGVDPGQMLAELQPHVPPPVSSTQNPFADDVDEDERLTVLLSDGERVSRAVSVYEPDGVADSKPLSLEFPEESPQSGISLDTRTLLSIEGGGEGRAPSGNVVRSRLVQDGARYEIKREFARGGMGRILLSRDLDVGRDVALKELLPELVGGGTRVGTRALGSAGGAESDETGDRFLREAKVTGQLEHPNIVPVYEIGERDDGSVYYTMKYVRGKTLAARLREIRKDDKLSDEQKNAERLKLLDAFVAMCNAIAFAHSRGVIHRDIKPENVMLGDFGETMLLDWGLARVKNQKDFAVKNRPKERNISDSLRENADASKTQDGYIIGTPAYMPPEQGRGDQEEVDEKSDIYSLGSVLYEILAGAPPYEGPTAGLVLQAMLTSPPAPISNKNRFAPPELVAVCEKAMSREKKDRFKSAMEISLQVQAFREGRNLSVYQYSARELLSRYVRRHRATVMVLALGALLTLAGGIYAAGVLINETALAQAARRDAEKARDTAGFALQAAKEEQRREQELKEADRKRREQEVRERAGTIRAMRQTVDGMRIGPIIDDCRERVLRYERAEDTSISASERRENQVLLASLVGYITAVDNLLGQLAGADAAALDESAGLDVAALQKQLERTRVLGGRLAAHSGDFALASHVLGGLTQGEAVVEKNAVLELCTRLLRKHRGVIEAVLADVQAGLQRPNRAADAPGLSDYVDELAALRDAQTVTLLQSALSPLQAKAESGSGPWTQEDYDLARLVLRVLGRIDLPALTVPVLAKFLPVVKEPELMVECALALCETRSPEAFEPLADIGRYRFNYIWESVEKKFAQVPLPQNVLKPASAAQYHRRSLARRARGDFEGAIADCSAALAIEPNAELLLAARAFARRGQGDLEGALTDFSAAIDLGGSQLARLLVARGNCLKQAGDIDRAIADFTRSINLDPRNPTPYIARGLARRDGGDLSGALADFSVALEFDPRRAQTWTYRGEAKAYMMDLAGAADDYTKAIACNPEYAEAYTLRGMIDRNRGRFTESIRDLTRASQLNPGDPRNYAWRAQSEFGNDDLVGAINSCTRAIELDERTWNAWYYRGITYLQLDARRATTTLSQSTASPDLDSAAKTSALRSAVSDIARAKELNEVDFLIPLVLASTYIQLGDRYFELGDLKAARESWQSCIDTYEALRRRNPFGAHYYNNPLSLDEADSNIAAARARIGYVETPSTAAEFLKRGLALALLGAQLGQGRKLDLLRQARGDFAKASELAGREAPGKLNAELASAWESMLDALVASGFFLDARTVVDALEKLGAPPQSLYTAACASSMLAGQFERGAVQCLGPTDAAKAELEYAANSQSAAAREQARNEALQAAAAMLVRSFEGGHGNLNDVAHDTRLAALRADARWPKCLEQLTAIVGARPKGQDTPPVPVIVVMAVAPKSLAEKAGIKSMDVIWMVNDTRPVDIAGIKNALLLGNAGESLKVVIRRYRVTQEGRFVLRLGADGKPTTDGEGRLQWDYTEHELQIKRGTVKSLGLMSGNITGVGAGQLPAATTR